MRSGTRTGGLKGGKAPSKMGRPMSGASSVNTEDDRGPPRFLPDEQKSFRIVPSQAEFHDIKAGKT